MTHEFSLMDSSGYIFSWKKLYQLHFYQPEEYLLKDPSSFMHARGHFDFCMTSSSGYLVKKGPKHKYLQRMCIAEGQDTIKGTVGSGGDGGQQEHRDLSEGPSATEISQMLPFKNADLLYTEQAILHVHTHNLYFRCEI